jgi:hypothetical protein
LFLVAEAEAAAISEREGELSAAIELRRRFAGIRDDAQARAQARTIAGWKRPDIPRINRDGGTPLI